MRECQRLHETAIKDVIDVLGGNEAKAVEVFGKAAKAGVDSYSKSNRIVGSIARRASNLVLVFPVLVSSSLSMETAVSISKAIERKCVSLLQILFSAINLTEFRDTKDLYDYIGKFHKNLTAPSGSLSIDDFIAVMDTIAENGKISITDKEAYDMVMESMRNINTPAVTEMNSVAVNDYKIKKTVYGESTVYLEDTYTAKATRDRTNEELRRRGIGGKLDKEEDELFDTTDSDADQKIRQFANQEIDKHTKEFNARAKNFNKKVNDDVNLFKNQITSNEVNKANELTPTTMIVNFHTAMDNGTTVNNVGVIGVKAKLYPIDSMEIINRVGNKYKDSNWLLGFIRASTNEISFLKDFAFAVDKAKLDAITVGRGSSNAKMFKLLERRAGKNKLLSFFRKNDASPIASLVLSQDEVEYLKKYNNMDLEKIGVAKIILDSYNLMDIVIVDEALEIARFLYDDGDASYESLTFDVLRKEDKDGSYKKIVNLMAKFNR